MYENRDDRSQISAARAGTAAAHIAHGAFTGGLHGALFAAAAEAAPSLVKLAVALAVLLLGLPFLIFLTLPCFLFGYEGANFSDVSLMTQQAGALGALWGSQRSLEDAAIDRISASLTGKTILSTEKELGNTNDYWLIAIASVAHAQEAGEITYDEAVTLMQAKLTYSLLPQYEDVEDENGEIHQVLKGYILKVTDCSPDALMDKLNFTEQQRQWATLIYSFMADGEYNAPSGSVPDGSDFDYSDIVFTGRGNSRDVVYFNQGDSRWGSLPYGKAGTVRSSGCGPSCMSIVISTLTSTTINPGEMCDWAYKHGYRCEGNGSYHTLIPGAAEAFGVPCEGLGRDKNKLVKALQNGKLVVAIMSKGHFTTGGHFIVLRGITDAGKILVADPASYKNSEKEWDVGIFLAECNKRAGSGGPFWALG